MLIIHHCPQPVILYNQVRVLLGCDNIHKAKKEKEKKKCKKKKAKEKGGCEDAENRPPDGRSEFYLSIVFANVKSSLYLLSDWYNLLIE